MVYPYSGRLLGGGFTSSFRLGSPGGEEGRFGPPTVAGWVKSSCGSSIRGAKSSHSFGSAGLLVNLLNSMLHLCLSWL